MSYLHNFYLISFRHFEVFYANKSQINPKMLGPWFGRNHVKLFSTITPFIEELLRRTKMFLKITTIEERRGHKVGIVM